MPRRERAPLPYGLTALAVVTVVGGAWTAAAWNLFSPSVGLLTGGVLFIQGGILALVGHWVERRAQARAARRAARWAQPVELLPDRWNVPDHPPADW